MLQTIRHQDVGELVVVAKLLTNYCKVSYKVADIDSYIKVNGVFDADYTAYMVSWQTNHGCTPDGIIGAETWTAISKAAPTCSTSRNRTSGYTLAIQLLLGGNLVADAIYGNRTKAAVAAYQSSNGLTADGICGPKTWGCVIAGSEAPSKFVQPKDFKQYSKPWGPKMYSNHNDHKQTMSNSGCGPTAVSDIVYTLKDNSIDPYVIAMMAVDWGDRSYNNGTNWTLFKPHIAEYYNFSKVVQTGSMATMKACLDAGGYVVCSMSSGYWTKGGHFITAWKYDENYIYANDPVSSERKRQNTKDFAAQCKQYFCYYPDVKEDGENVVDDDYAYNPAVSDRLKRGSKIVDISKWQPTVNYDALIGDTALIILRAGYRGTGGGIHRDENVDLHGAELLKRGVRFGVYFYSIATNEDAAREEARMFWQYAKDFQPLFWAGDFEKDGITSAAILAFVDELRRLGAEKVGCYIANHLYQKYGYASIRDRMDFTWIPRYGSTRPAYTCDLWQYTSTGKVDGIAGNVDLNGVTGDGHTLEWFCGGDEA